MEENTNSGADVAAHCDLGQVILPWHGVYRMSSRFGFSFAAFEGRIRN